MRLNLAGTTASRFDNQAQAGTNRLAVANDTLDHSICVGFSGFVHDLGKSHLGVYTLSATCAKIPELGQQVKTIDFQPCDITFETCCRVLFPFISYIAKIR